MSAWTYRRSTARPPLRLFHLVFEPHDGRAFCADSEEKREPVSDIDTAVVQSLKALDPKRPIREADMLSRFRDVRFRGRCGHPYAGICTRGFMCARPGAHRLFVGAF